MPAKKGNKHGKQFSSEYQPKEKWTEKKALQLANNLIDWLRSETENIFYNEFLVIENDYPKSTIDYLSRKFKSFSEIIKKAKEIQEVKLNILSTANKLNPTMSIFMLKNHHGYTDKKEIEQTNINEKPIKIIVNSETAKELEKLDKLLDENE